MICCIISSLRAIPELPDEKDGRKLFFEKKAVACNIFPGLPTLYKTNHLDISIPIPAVELLVEQSTKGDAAAYRQLYNRYAKAMYNTALRITGVAADAEDILQESFTDAYLQLSGFQHKATFGAWLKQIVVYKSIGLLKKKKVRFTSLEEEYDIAADEAINEDEIAMTVNAVKKALALLPDGYRTVLSLYLLEGYDQEEIGEIMELAPSTVRTQYLRGKQRLLQLMKKEAYDE